MRTTIKRPRGPLAPNPELWAALRDGDGLTEILTDFYGRVYDDPKLAPFFAGATKQRLIEKQYSFLREIFTGERVYFGDRPRNAHHWMVISDELFDYREELMALCLRHYGLSEELIAQWRAAEEAFRSQIVKDAPRGRVVAGVETPVEEGYGAIELAEGSLCDGCGAPMDKGAKVEYHLRTGQTYCHGCRPISAS